MHLKWLFYHFTIADGTPLSYFYLFRNSVSLFHAKLPLDPTSSTTFLLKAEANNRFSLQKLAAKLNVYLCLTGYSFKVEFTTRVNGRWAVSKIP